MHNSARNHSAFKSLLILNMASNYKKYVNRMLISLKKSIKKTTMSNASFFFEQIHRNSQIFYFSNILISSQTNNVKFMLAFNHRRPFPLVLCRLKCVCVNFFFYDTLFTNACKQKTKQRKQQKKKTERQGQNQHSTLKKVIAKYKFIVCP